jgi:tripartite-type tricarboxylate transporter receptor subunit TctC
LAVLTLVAIVAAMPVRAQDYPTRPVKLVVPFPPAARSTRPAGWLRRS